MDPIDVQARMEDTARSLIQAYPLAPGLTSVSDVINQLPPARPFPATLFTSCSPATLVAGPPEPLFSEYERELECLLNPRTDESGEQTEWRAAQLQRIGPMLSEQGWGDGLARLRYAPPPFAASGDPSPAAPHHSDSPAFFQAFLDDIRPRAQVVPATLQHLVYQQSSTPIHSNGNGTFTPVAESSPDPLRMDSTVPAYPSRPPFALNRRASQVSIDSKTPRKRPSTTDLHRTPPPADLSPSKSVQRSGSALSSVIDEAGVAAAGSRMEDGTPPGANGTGVESAVKRIKLGFTGASFGTSGGTVRASDGNDIIESVSDLVSDLFQTDDAYIGNNPVPAYTKSPGSTAGDFFRSTATTTDNSPLLKTNFIKKLTKQLLVVQSRNKGEALLAEIEESGIARLLKILERSWQGVELLQFWGGQALEHKKQEMGGDDWVVKGSGKKGAKGKGKGKSVSPTKGRRKSKAGAEEDSEDDEDRYLAAQASRKAGRSRSHSRSASPGVGSSKDMDLGGGQDAAAGGVWDEAALLAFGDAHRHLSDALLSIRAALVVLSITDLPKPLYSAEYISSILTSLRITLDSFLYPVLESQPSSHLADLSERVPECFSSITEAFAATVPLATRLFRQEAMSEEIVIPTTYFALSPFFHEAAVVAGKGKAAPNVVDRGMKAIRMASLGLVRVLFGRYVAQRESIIDEVLLNVSRVESMRKGKGAVGLRNGTTIHTVSALLLHLVQTCPSDLAPTMHSKLVTQDVEMGIKFAVDEADAMEIDDSPLLPRLTKSIVEPALESAMKSARTIMGHLFQRSCKVGKATASSSEAEYRSIFDNLVGDLLSALRMPEWPAAELMLSVCTRSMMLSIADPKTTHEVTAMKGVSLDHVGTIAARLRSDSLKETVDLKTHQEILDAGDTVGLDALVTAEQELISHLTRDEKTEGSGEGAADFTAAIQFRDLVHAFTLSTTRLERFSPAQQTESKEGRRAKALNVRYEDLCMSFWQANAANDVFAPSAVGGQPRVDSIAASLARSQPLAAMYTPLLQQILEASESTAVSFRTKALRAISLVVAQDPDLFFNAGVRRAIEARLLDSSPAVRDAALELVGKYVVGRPDLAVEYLPKICERINDTGLGVRRRVVKLLKVLYLASEDEASQIEICRRLVYRVQDEDDGIRELAVDAVEEMWFTKSHTAKVKQVDLDDSQGTDQVVKSALSRLAAMIVKVTGTPSGDRPPPVDDLLRQIFAKHAEKGTKPPLHRLQQITECLIDGLVEDHESVRASIVTCVKTIYVLTSTDPSILSTAKATILLPFLKSATTAEEQVICEYLLKIFRSAVVAMPKSTAKFSKDLQTALIPMINKPPPVNATLQEVVACFCAVVRGQTHDFVRLITIFKACISRLRNEQALLTKPVEGKSPNLRALPMLCSLSGLLCEHGDFDQIRRAFPETRASIDAISPAPIVDFVYTTFIQLYRLPVGPTNQGTILACLGFLYRSYPMLMLKPGSTSIMDEIFALGPAGAASQVQLLRIIQDFLACQGRPSSGGKSGKVKVEGGAKMEELVGNVDGFADSGVASAVCQRYIDEILTHSLSMNSTMQRLAFDILASIARSGFGHPLSISPTLVALTAAPDAQLSSRAHSMLSLLYQKHASLLSTRFVESAKTSFGYARAVARDSLVHGYADDPPDSHFGRWYNLHKDKRMHKLDFLKALSRTFELDLAAKCTEEDSSLARYIGEAVSTLDFKNQEEVMMILSYLNSALAVSGLQVLHLLEAGVEGGGLLGGNLVSPVKSTIGPDGTVTPSSFAPKASLAHQSIICGIAMLLRDHLKHLYSITDVKMSKYSLGKKTALGDRAVTRRVDAPLALGLDGYARMPYAISKLDSQADRIQQRDTYIGMVQDDGTMGAVDELEDDD